MVVHVLGDLEAHRRAEATPGELLLQGGEQVLDVVLLDLEVLVAGDPEGEVLADLHAREELVQVRGDDVLEGNEPCLVEAGQRQVGRLDLHEAGQQQRHLDAGEVLDARSWG